MDAFSPSNVFRWHVSALMVSFGAALVAVTTLYAHRNGALLSAALFVFLVLPALAGIVCSRSLPQQTLYIAAGLLALCPIVYLLTDPLAAEFEKIRDAFFVMSGVALIFAASSDVVRGARVKNWVRVGLDFLAMLVGLLFVFFTLSLIVFLE